MWVEIVADTIASHNQVLCRGFGRGLTLCYISSWMELISPFDFVKRSILAVQEYTYLSLRSLANLFRKPFYMADTIQQADLIGVGSLPIVVLTGMFTGIVLALNTSKTLESFGSLSMTGRLVSFSMVRELGPGAYQPDGDGAQRFRHGQRTWLHESDGTD